MDLFCNTYDFFLVVFIQITRVCYQCGISSGEHPLQHHDGGLRGRDQPDSETPPHSLTPFHPSSYPTHRARCQTQAGLCHSRGLHQTGVGEDIQRRKSRVRWKGAVGGHAQGLGGAGGIDGEEGKSNLSNNGKITEMLLFLKIYIGNQCLTSWTSMSTCIFMSFM